MLKYFFILKKLFLISLYQKQYKNIKKLILKKSDFLKRTS